MSKQNENSDLSNNQPRADDPGNKKKSIARALLIGFAAGVFFILAASLVKFALG